MRAFTVTITRRGRRRLRFEAMAPDAVVCTQQHRDLVADGETMLVEPLKGERAVVALRRAQAVPALARLLHTTRLAWWRWALRDLSAKQPMHPDLPMVAARVAQLEAGRA